MTANVVLLSSTDPYHKYVLTQGYRGRLMNKGDCAVYRGYHEDSDHTIAVLGTKVDWVKAQELFPRHVTSEGMYRK